MNCMIKKGFALLLLFAATSCGGTKKLAFDSAYKFSSYNYNKSGATSMWDTAVGFSAEQLTASLRTADISSREIGTTSFSENIYEKIGVPQDNCADMDADQIKQQVATLSLAEKREIRKDLRKKIRKLKKEIDDPSATLDVNRVQEISELMRWLIIFGSVGLVLLILGAIFTVGILTFFGALLVVGAAVLFILDQV